MTAGCSSTASPMTLLGPDGKLSPNSRMLGFYVARSNLPKAVEQHSYDGLIDSQ